MVSRRSFVINASMAAATVCLIPSFAFTFNKKTIGLQLYTLRDELPKDVKGTLEKVAEAGYTEVELYGFSIKDKFWGLSAQELKKLLDANGLKAVSGHYGLGTYLSDGNTTELEVAIKAAKVLNSEYITVPWLDESLRKSADDYKRIASLLNKAGEMCKEAGLKLAYHNHDFEFKKYNGVTGYEILLKETDKNLVYFEMDLYWMAYSKNDPIELFKQNEGRFTMWHVKDMDKNNATLNAEIGSGSIDFKSIFAEAKRSGMKYLFVEQETNYKSNAIESIKTSCRFIEKELI
ncbi:sugar phosphate isomerase/epimerase [Flavobacterium sp. LS1R47]|jgi:sugar phosphate isomerase/epimerase|uniref:Sugar phosphate isomerase/epimerase n=1 Tax=Flavobacterium frigoritolerans TaxID=2987686 RepID=A0A9X2ZR48_9FLAO|nr:sugar phosphate isomerase/epimerase [Flavobacterium frigoritolerans]MCV9933381.1 sugar phosphate isomerase/epimerase [Flavobacterium frigoritolerans]